MTMEIEMMMMMMMAMMMTWGTLTSEYVDFGRIKCQDIQLRRQVHMYGGNLLPRISG